MDGEAEGVVVSGGGDEPDAAVEGLTQEDGAAGDAGDGPLRLLEREDCAGVFCFAEQGSEQGFALALKERSGHERAHIDGEEFTAAGGKLRGDAVQEIGFASAGVAEDEGKAAMPAEGAGGDLLQLFIAEEGWLGAGVKLFR